MTVRSEMTGCRESGESLAAAVDSMEAFLSKADGSRAVIEKASSRFVSMAAQGVAGVPGDGEAIDYSSALEVSKAGALVDVLLKTRLDGCKSKASDVDMFNIVTTAIKQRGFDAVVRDGDYGDMSDVADLIVSALSGHQSKHDWYAERKHSGAGSKRSLKAASADAKRRDALRRLASVCCSVSLLDDSNRKMTLDVARWAITMDNSPLWPLRGGLPAHAGSDAVRVLDAIEVELVRRCESALREEAVAGSVSVDSQRLFDAALGKATGSALAAATGDSEALSAVLSAMDGALVENLWVDSLTGSAWDVRRGLYKQGMSNKVTYLKKPLRAFMRGLQAAVREDAGLDDGWARLAGDLSEHASKLLDGDETIIVPREQAIRDLQAWNLAGGVTPIVAYEKWESDGVDYRENWAAGKPGKQAKACLKGTALAKLPSDYGKDRAHVQTNASSWPNDDAMAVAIVSAVDEMDSISSADGIKPGCSPVIMSEFLDCLYAKLAGRRFVFDWVADWCRKHSLITMEDMPVCCVDYASRDLKQVVFDWGLSTENVYRVKQIDARAISPEHRVRSASKTTVSYRRTKPLFDLLRDQLVADEDNVVFSDDEAGGLIKHCRNASGTNEDKRIEYDRLVDLVRYADEIGFLKLDYEFPASFEEASASLERH